MKRMLVFGVALLVIAGCSSAATTTPPPTLQSIYVGNVGNNSISVFTPHSNGNVAPTSTIVGALTLINQPYYIFVDSSGNIWASNWSSGGAGSITKYAPGTTGNTAPTNTITGAATLLVGPCGIFVDSAGKIYSANCDGPTVNVYAAGTTGNTAPAQSIAGAATTLTFPEGVTLDAAGDIWVGDCLAGAGVKEWPNNATGNMAPTKTITNAAMTCVDGVAIDGAGNIYAANRGGAGDAIFVFAPSASGASVPIATITGAGTLLSTPYSLVLDQFGDIWVGNSTGVTAWPPGTTGNVAPTVSITGAATLVNEPWGLALH